jgi:hypothetical protein
MAEEFTVIYSSVVKARIRALHARSKERGDLDNYLQALIALDDRLHADARTFGEPLYHLSQSQVRQGVERPVVATWAVHDSEPVVFVKNFVLLTRRP